MKLSIAQYRTMIDVFRSFGLMKSVNWKNKSFLRDFQLNQIFVHALLFEMELRLGIYLEEDEIDKCISPNTVISAFKEVNNINKPLLAYSFSHKEIIEQEINSLAYSI